MDCPMCGFEPVLGRDVDYMDATMCQCPKCYYRWIQIGRRQRFREEQSKAFREWWYTVWIYCLHGLIVWSIFSSIHFLILVLHPFQTLVEFGIWGAGAIIGLVAIAGVCLGYGLQEALNITSRLWPTVKTLHILVPLLTAACIGGSYGGLLCQLIESYLGLREATLNIRGDLLSVILGAIFGITVTPIIIVRCSKARARKGFCGSLPKPKDPRWEC